MQGELHIGFRADAMFAELPSLLRTFGERFPDVDLKLTKIANREYVSGLLDGRFDLAWAVPAVDERIETLAVSIDNLVAAVPMSHRLAARERIRIDDLHGEPMVLANRGCAPMFHDAVVALCKKRNVTPSRFIDVSDEVAGLGLVAAGLGVALVPSSWSKIGVSDVVFRELDCSVGFEEALCWLRGRETPAMRAFIDLARAKPPETRATDFALYRARAGDGSLGRLTASRHRPGIPHRSIVKANGVDCKGLIGAELCVGKAVIANGGVRRERTAVAILFDEMSVGVAQSERHFIDRLRVGVGERDRDESGVRIRLIVREDRIDLDLVELNRRGGAGIACRAGALSVCRCENRGRAHCRYG